MAYATTLKETIDFAANEWKSIKLPALRCITEIDLRVILNVTGGSGTSPTAHAPLSVIKNINIAKGGKYPIQATGWLLYVKNYYEHRGKVVKGSLPGDGETKDVEFELIIHPGYFIDRKDDNSVALRTDDVETYLQVLWGNASDLGANYTINSGTIYVTVWFRNDVLPRRTPAWEIITKSIDQTYSDLGLEVELPVGKLIPKAIIEVLDSGGADSDDVVTEIGLIDKRAERRELHRISYKTQQYDDSRRYLVDPLTGHIIFDAAELGLSALIGTKNVFLGFS